MWTTYKEKTYLRYFFAYIICYINRYETLYEFIVLLLYMFNINSQLLVGCLVNEQKSYNRQVLITLYGRVSSKYSINKGPKFP